jgi:membrane peptidoglycan carboxypeptidase
MTDEPMQTPAEPTLPRPVRRRASAFHRAQHAAWLRRRAVRFGALGVVVLLVLGVLATGAAAAGLGSLPNADSMVAQPLPSDTLVYDRTGQVLLADLHQPGYQHYQASLASMGRYLPEATVAIEDANFWNEPGGVDPLSVARAGWTDVKARHVVEGGSTITQQLVKRRLVGDDRSFARKFREASLAMRISADFSKRQILEMYMNAIAYGNAAYGAQAAARIYFHVDANRLDLAQAALLAGLPQDPTLLNPLRHREAAKQRQQAVLDAMVRAHDITQEQADEASAEDLTPPGHIFGPTAQPMPSFVDWVTGELADRFGKDAVTGGGLRVVTTLDVNLQQLAQKAVAEGVAQNRWRSLTDGALVSIDPHTGQVLALVGSAGPDVPGGQYNMAVWPPRNPGSSFKALTYAAAIDSKRYTMVTPVRDTPITVQMPGWHSWTPKNYDLGYHGTCQLQVCLGNSLNIPAVEVELGTGMSDVVGVARKLGAPPYVHNDKTNRYTDSDGVDAFGPTLTLGGYGETPLQMATAMSALAAGGALHEPEGLLGVSDSTGRQRYQAGGDGRQVLDAGTAYIVSQMLSDAGNRAMIFGRSTPLTLPGRHAAAKTGTTDDFKDAWTVGYTPALATAVWMGNTDVHAMAQGSDGMVVAAPAWHQYMQAALDQLGRGDDWYQAPQDVQTQYVGGRPAYFLAGTSPAQAVPQLPSWVRGGGGASSGSGGDTSGHTGPGCRSWTVNGASYWSCTQGDSGLPGDPGGG